MPDLTSAAVERGAKNWCPRCGGSGDNLVNSRPGSLDPCPECGGSGKAGPLAALITRLADALIADWGIDASGFVRAAPEDLVATALAALRLDDPETVERVAKAAREAWLIAGDPWDDVARAAISALDK